MHDGAEVVLLGRVNAGKSSLLNALVGEERALVDAEAGTTRDAVEAEVDWGGLSVRLVDTAGDRFADSSASGEPTELERRGLELARKRRGRADAFVLVVDGTVGFLDGERALAAQLSPLVVAWNKRDLAPPPPAPPAGDIDINIINGGVVETSARTGEGVDELKRAILGALGQLDGESGALVVSLQAKRGARTPRRRLLEESRGGGARFGAAERAGGGGGPDRALQRAGTRDRARPCRRRAARRHLRALLHRQVATWDGRGSATVIAGGDALVVLGAALARDGSLGPALAEQVEAGVAAWKAGRAPLLVMTGALEASAMRARAVELGVPTSGDSGRGHRATTRERRAVLEWSAALARPARVLIVTQPYHRRRSVAAFRRAVSVAAEALRFSVRCASRCGRGSAASLARASSTSCDGWI